MLPDAVQQGLGWQPQPLQPLPDYGGLPPEVAQAIGLVPPPVAPPPIDLAPPPIPTQLPSAVEPAPEQPPAPTHPDYVVPAPVAPPPVAAPKPAKPPTPDQQLANVQQRQGQADQASMGAIRDQEAVNRAKAADDLALFQQHDVRAKEIEAQRKAQADEYTKVHATKQAYVDSTLKAVDDYKVDQNKYWKESGVGDHIGWYVAMALSSFGDALQKKSGPNPIVQMLQDKMHQSVVAQMDERDQLKQRNARAEHALDKYDAFSQSREAQIALLDSRNDRSLANQLMTAAAKYADPLAVAKAQKEAADLMQQSVAKAEKSVEFAATYSVQKGQLDVARGHLAVQLRDEQRKENAAKVAEQVFTPDQLKILNPDLPVPKIGMTQKKYDDWLQTQKHGEDYKTAARTNDPQERLRQLSVPGVVTESGEAALFRDPALATKTGALKAVAEDMVRATDEMRALIKKNGFEPKFWNSDAGQKARATYAHVLVQTKEADKLGVLAGPDMGILEKQIGTDDPGKFLSALAGIENFRHHTVERFNAELRNSVVVPQGQKLARWEPVDPSKLPPPPVTQEDVVRKTILGKQSDDPGATYNPELKRFEPNIAGLDNPGVRAAFRPDSPTDIAPYQARTNDEVSKKFPGVGGATRALLETTWSRLNSTDPTVRSSAKELLETVVKSAGDDDVSDFAKFLLAKKRTYDMTEEKPGRSVAAPSVDVTPDALRQLGIDAR